jgi:heterodisulfide reductase subunit A-like polyferredoxin
MDSTDTWQLKEVARCNTIKPLFTGDFAMFAAARAAPPIDLSRYTALSEGQVVPEAQRCVQCGICSYNCPINIDVRAHAWRGLPVHDRHCLTCGQCVQRCPRGVLRFERIELFGA